MSSRRRMNSYHIQHIYRAGTKSPITGRTQGPPLRSMDFAVRLTFTAQERHTTMRPGILLLLFLVIAAPSAHAADIVTGLVGHWKLDGNAKDYSGKGIGGTIYGATATMDRLGRVGNALSFNGTSNYVDLGSGNNVNFGAGDFTIALWLGPRTENTGWSWEVSKNHGGPGFIIATQGQLRVSVGAWFTDVVTGARGSLNQALWHHIVVLRRSGTVYTYVNGGLYGTPVASNYDFLAVATKALILGVKDPATSTFEWLNGKLDDVRIYNRALTASDVTALYNNGGPTAIKNARLSRGVIK